MKPLASQLNPKLLARSKQLERLTLCLRQQLSADCDGHYAVANISQQQLVIIADSPVWAGRLRQLAPQILAIVQPHAKQIRHIQVKSRPATPHTSRIINGNTATTRRQISQHASKLIESAASCISDHSLKSALLKLSRHKGRNN